MKIMVHFLKFLIFFCNPNFVKIVSMIILSTTINLFSSFLSFKN